MAAGTGSKGCRQEVGSNTESLNSQSMPPETYFLPNGHTSYINPNTATKRGLGQYLIQVTTVSALIMKRQIQSEAKPT